MKELEDELNLNPIMKVEPELQESNGSVEEAKEHIISARDLAMTAVQDMLDIAKQSQDYKAYDVLNSLIKTYSDISSGVVDLDLKQQRLEKGREKKEEKSGPQTVNQNLFVTTDELFKMISDMGVKK